jgi:hypothetical protein
MRHCNFMVAEASAVKNALIADAKASYAAGIDTREDMILDIAIIKSRPHDECVKMLRQRDIPYPNVNYRRAF